MKKILLIFSVFVLSFSAVADVAPNPRTMRNAADIVRESATVSRSSRRVTPTVARSGVITTAARTARSATPSSTVRAVSRSATSAPRGMANISRSATSSVRSATTPARSGATKTNISRAATTTAHNRATAVFDDVSKIGAGYAGCRDAYNTCMDQFCAKSNDAFRRCSCSDRAAEFAESEEMLFNAKTLLQQFQDVNLSAVGMTAGEVNAMFTATVGEQAIKNDTSGAAKVLAQIDDLISGKKAAADERADLFDSLTSFSSDPMDIFSADGGFDLFANRRGNINDLTGDELYQEAHEQCMNVMAAACESDAMSSMAQSAYSILVGQDCNTYEKTVDAQKEALAQTVMTAEKYLRDARLDEYRSHNSADMNACIAAVKTAVTADTACGADYKKCLDYTGNYVKTDGTPIYGPQLFKLDTQINLMYDDYGDILSANADFNRFLDDKRMFAVDALDTCRDLNADNAVWTEFKRQAMIEISQAQSALIEDVKSTCVATIADCYDTQTGALKEMDDTRSQSTGAITAYTASAMCKEQVTACAALYTDPAAGDVECQFDSRTGRLTTPNCGLAALVNFVSLVDNVKVAEGCETALLNYVKDTCTPTTGGQDYPYNCRSLPKAGATGSLESLVRARAEIYCINPQTRALDPMVDSVIVKILSDIDEEMQYSLATSCEDEYMGTWVSASDAIGQTKNVQFYRDVRGIAAPAPSAGSDSEFGYCVENTVAMQCVSAESMTGNAGYAAYDPITNRCDLGEEWYATQCAGALRGVWDSSAKRCWYVP